MELEALQQAWTRAGWDERGPLCAAEFGFRSCVDADGALLSQPAAAARERAMDRRSPSDFRAEVVEERVAFFASGWVTRRRLVVSGGGSAVAVSVCHVVEAHDGRVTRFEEYYDPSGLRAAFPERYMPHLYT